MTISAAEYEAKKKIWLAETNFLIAYFHSVLLQNYGPVVIVDSDIPLDGEGETFFRPRNHTTNVSRQLEECLIKQLQIYL